MEEDVGVTVIVTRLRRRLSVEQAEDASSPSTSKKRVGRLAAKPQLDLIDENVQVSSPRKTRKKSITKDVADDEKPVTPSRRSTRIKSNTSIVSETLSIQATDSPRAKRALRRNSAAGSDNEGPATPARQTRRTRKDSASSVENQEPATVTRPKVVEMVIAEEPENDVQKSEKETVVKKSKSSPSNAVTELSPNSPRKSKRLSEKRKRRSGSNISDLDSSVTAIENKSLNISAKDEVTKSKTEMKSPKQSNESAESNELSERLSDSNLNLLKTLNTEAKVKKSNNNKSVSALDSEQNGKKKRIRTESWPALLTVSPAKDNIVFSSDNEQAKKKKNKSANIQSFLNEPSSGLNRSSSKEDNANTRKNEKDTSSILDSPSKKKKNLSETSFTKNVNEPSKNMEHAVALTSIGDSSSSKENTVKKPENNDIASDMEMLFQNPQGNVQAIVYFEDSDSNSVNTETAKKIQQLDSEDQCVPVIKNDIEYKDKVSSDLSKSSLNSNKIFFSSQTVSDKEHDISNTTKANDDVQNSCEPMDIDETIPEEILQKSQNTLQESATERKSLTLPQGSSILEETNKSKRKSSVAGRDTPDRSSNENKSTLILSQIKDVSTTSEIIQSPKPVTNELSNSITDNDSGKVSKKNVSSNDLKETPLRPKNVTDLTMQTSTPITTPRLENKTKVEQKNHSPKKDHSNLSKSMDDSQSSDEDTDEPSEHKSKLLDDEAEEASDDYESGDSRDEEDKQYEEEHEIVERGETLGSDESDGDVSNDSDYEKDSFIVSSDAEDNDLLSGSGDDLSSGDNELSMSKKSKKKYNERKLKEQKAASREMFESRHKLNTSKSPAPKSKSNRMRIDSSLVDSDEEVVVKPKKNNRLRLDSTLDTSEKQEDTNESLKKSKRKSNKPFQESIYNESANNEKEITLCDENISNADPLQVHFKQEPKTPQKDLNISVVQFTDRKDIETVEVAESNSMLNQTETDPLQATTVCGDTSDSSESEEILQNYDSVLNELNKNNKGKLSNNNISLHMDKKGKNKNATIIDQLNLTKTKTPNKDKNTQSIDVVDSKTIESSKKTQDSDSESSSSIDLQLLFSQDSGSGDENTTKNEQKNKDEEQMFVPLRKSIAKTNICESKDMNVSQQDLSLTESSKKKKKRKTSVVINESEAELEDPNQFEQDEKALNASLNKKKNRKSSLVPSESVEEPLDTNQGDENVIVLNKSNKKKKQRASLSATELEAESRGVNESMDALLNESSSKKKKNTNTSVVEEPQDVPDDEIVVNESAKKKKKRKSSSGTVEVANSEGDLFFIDTTGARVSETDDMTPVEVLYVNEKKKKNKKIDGSQNIVETNGNLGPELTNGTHDQIVEESMRLTPKTQKKKNKSHEMERSVFCDDDSDGAPEEVLFRSEKASNQDNELHNTESITESVDAAGGKKKKKKKKLSAASDHSVENVTIAEDSSVQNSKKRKRKSSDTGGEQSSVAQASQEAKEHRTQNESLSVGSHKKKRKISNNTEVTEQTSVEADNIAEDERKSKKKKHKKNLELNFQSTAPEPEISHVQVKKNKKRKERDEDIDNKKTKVSKENSFQEVHKIPLLPASIISQLEDKPRKLAEKPKVISTSKFIVEPARQKRAKPSNYLEESIYLNADSPLAKQEKSRIKKPKVLPFIPTASISGSGYTTNFKINQLSQNVQFAAEPAGITFSKEKYLQKKEIKRLGTYDRYKKQINKKLSKF